MACSEQLPKENPVKISKENGHKVYRACRLVPVFQAGRPEQSPGREFAS